MLFMCVCASACFSQNAASQIKRMRATTRGRETERKGEREREKLGQRSKYQVRCQRQIIHSTEVSHSLCPFVFTVSLHLHLFQCLFQLLSEYNTFPNVIFYHFCFCLRRALFKHEQPLPQQSLYMNALLICQTHIKLLKLTCTFSKFIIYTHYNIIYTHS